jgi:manganese transport protein
VIADLPRGFVPRGDDGAASLVAPVAGGGWSIQGLHGDSLYNAIGILGATVMPHNLYLHSALVQSRVVGRSAAEKRQATRMNLIDSAVALNAAFFVNAAILVVAAAAFHTTGHQDVARLEDAHQLLAPLLGTSAASVLFAVALLASGQSSTITGTLAGQVVMEGFLRLRLQPWLRRAVSRGLAIIPAALVIALRGEGSVDDLLVLSQVVLSLQLSFAIIPLITFTSQRSHMGEFANPKWVVALSCLVAAIIMVLNGKLVFDFVADWHRQNPGAWWLMGLVTPAVVVVVLFLAAIIAMPILQRWRLLSSPSPIPTVPPIVTEAVRRTTAARPPRTLVATGPRRVALALELGPADLPVLEHACSMPLPADAEIVLLHVAESAASRFLGRETSDLETREDLGALETMAADLRAAGIPTRVMLGNGDVKSELARMVKEIDADLLITGSHGHRFFGDLFLGATTSGLRHRVACPVLAIRARR